MIILLLDLKFLRLAGCPHNKLQALWYGSSAPGSLFHSIIQPKSHFELPRFIHCNLILDVTALIGGIFWEVIKSQGLGLYEWDLCPYKREWRELPYFLCHLGNRKNGGLD
jgi:hypothetical protein